MANQDKKRVLITGVSGLLGNNLAFCLRENYKILGLYNAHEVEIEGIATEKVDLSREDEVRAVINRFKPEVIVHCAAISDIEYCEGHQDLADRVNVLGTKTLVDQMGNNQTKLIYISTDTVYNATHKQILREDDEIGPVNHYGQTKYAGEQEALKRDNVLVLRTNIFGWNIQNKFSIAEWVIHQLLQNKEIQGFSDAVFSSIYTFDLANILDKIIEKDLKGIYNCCSRTSMSKYDFARRIAKYFQLDETLIKKASVDDYGFKAKRGKYLAMDAGKIESALGIQLPSLEESIKNFYIDHQHGLPDKIKSVDYPHLDYIPYGRQHVNNDDIRAVINVLKSQYLTQGPKISMFEGMLSKVTEASHVVAVNSGTSALHIACLAAGIGPGDEVVTSGNTFVASANCVVYCGGKPVFADIDPRTYNVTAAQIEKKINQRTKAVIPVHFAGQSCDMQAIERVVRSYEKKYGRKIYIIEDACHALGSKYKETNVGSCAFSDMAILSFHPVKHITTGEGGAVLTNDKGLHRTLSYLRSHGITNTPEEILYRDQGFEPKTGDDGKPLMRPWYYEQNCLGFNYRITDIQCALGLSQLKRLDRFILTRREGVDRYNRAFKDVDWMTTPFEDGSCCSNFHLYVVYFHFDKMPVNRAQFMNELRRRGVQTQVHYIPVYTQPFYKQRFGYDWGLCSETERYYQGGLSIPLYPGMTEEDMKKVIHSIIEVGQK